MTILSCKQEPRPDSGPQPAPATEPSLVNTSLVKIEPDIAPTALLDARKMMPFKAVDSPEMVKASHADFLKDDEYVLGITVGGQSRAYPVRFVWFHHVINDKISTPGSGEKFVAVTYCSTCNIGICYMPMVKGKPLKFDFFGLYNGVATLCERETEGVFLLAEGRIVTGPLRGTRLASEPLLDTTWGKWKRLHPNTLVMSPDSRYDYYYGNSNWKPQRGATRLTASYFHSSLTRGDKRLPPFDKVLGVTLAPKGKTERSLVHRAYTMKALAASRGVVNDHLGNSPVAVLMDPDTQTASAVSRRIDGRTLTFEARRQADGDTVFYDTETGTRWNMEGKGEEGPLAGRALQRLNNHLSQWYGWSATFPDTSIFGRKDPPAAWGSVRE